MCAPAKMMNSNNGMENRLIMKRRNSICYYDTNENAFVTEIIGGTAFLPRKMRSTLDLCSKSHNPWQAFYCEDGKCDPCYHINNIMVTKEDS